MLTLKIGENNIEGLVASQMDMKAFGKIIRLSKNSIFTKEIYLKIFHRIIISS